MLSLDDSLRPVMPLVDGAVDEPFREFALLSDDHMLELLDKSESSLAVRHLLKGTPNSFIDWNYVRAVRRLGERDVLMSLVRRVCC